MVKVFRLKDGKDPGVYELGGFDVRNRRIDRTVGGGANRAERRELIIYSWNRVAELAGLL
ncbi:hypothetical protein [Variovorax sp. OV084]|uniref:hypothetical protein n=1 Tax=Variovorax sp. OV084 TaxID=1882777 RepID=UPI00115FB9F8|nr:hypothetical protein [Variovorax sp. OV084]